jgi:Putative beta-barrel porin-2, OmpL-like. bbp2
MKLGLVILCVGAVAVLLRILMGLISELRMSRSQVVPKAESGIDSEYKGTRAIFMSRGNRTRQILSRNHSRIAMLTLVFVTLAIPLHGQEPSASPAPAATNSEGEEAPELLKELDAMKLRIEKLEAQLKQRDIAEQPAEVNHVDPQPAVPSPNMSMTTNNAGAETSTESVPPQSATSSEPFAFADWLWLNGNPRTKEAAFDSKFFTPEIRADVDYTYDFNHPKDDTVSGSSEIFRSNEIGLTQLGVGGDFHYDHVRARFMTQFGTYSQGTPRNDASYSRGQWNLGDAYRYLSEAYGGYHFDALHGINVDAGIFMSYVGLFSYYNFDNWAYQPSYVSSNTPWFFTGMRIQIFPTNKLKIEPWIINGWQSYARSNGRIGLGGQILYRPTSWLSIISNNYGVGADAFGIPNRTRMHTDNSIEVKYYDHPKRFVDKMAFTLTGDLGCETGGGVNCTTNQKNSSGQVVSYKQAFLGFMLYNRWWFHKDRYAFTLGGGKINNPGRYLVLIPPIDGATATTGTPYFTENPGDPFKAWDISGTYDYMPSQYITFRWEFNHRHANVPYWSGPGGVTPPGGNNGTPGAMVAGWQPDLRNTEDRATMAILVKF